MNKTEIAVYRETDPAAMYFRIPFTQIKVDLSGLMGLFSFVPKDKAAVDTPTKAKKYGRFVDSPVPTAYVPSMTSMEELILDPEAADRRIQQQNNAVERQRAAKLDYEARQRNPRLHTLFDKDICIDCGGKLDTSSRISVESSVIKTCSLCDAEYGRNLHTYQISQTRKGRELKSHPSTGMEKFQKDICGNCGAAMIIMSSSGKKVCKSGVAGTRKKCEVCTHEVRGVHDRKSYKLVEIEVLNSGKKSAKPKAEKTQGKKQGKPKGMQNSSEVLRTANLKEAYERMQEEHKARRDRDYSHFFEEYDYY